MTAVSLALGSPLELHEEMADLVRNKMGENANEDAVQKMATFPKGAKLLFLEGVDKWPILKVGKVFVLPGVPEYFETKMTVIATHLQFQRNATKFYKVVLDVDEHAEGFVALLDKCVEDHPRCAFGSYPAAAGSDHKTVVTVEGRGAGDELARERGSRRSGGGGAGGNGARESGTEEEEEDVGGSDGEIEGRTAAALEQLLDGLAEGALLRVEEQ